MGSGASKKKKKEKKNVTVEDVGNRPSTTKHNHNKKDHHKKEHHSEEKHKQPTAKKIEQFVDDPVSSHNHRTNKTANITNNNEPVTADGLDPFEDEEQLAKSNEKQKRDSVDSLEGLNILSMIDAKVQKRKEQDAVIQSIIDKPEHYKHGDYSTKTFNDALDEIDHMMEEQHKVDEKLETKLHRPAFKFDPDKFKKANQNLDKFEIESGGEKDMMRFDDDEDEEEENFDAYSDPINNHNNHHHDFHDTQESMDKDSLDMRFDDLDESLMRDIERNLQKTLLQRTIV